MKRRLIDGFMKRDRETGLSVPDPEAVVVNCLHCGQDIKQKDFFPAYCPHCGREPDPPIGFLLELAEEGKLNDYLRGKYP